MFSKMKFYKTNKIIRLSGAIVHTVGLIIARYGCLFNRTDLTPCAFEQFFVLPTPVDKLKRTCKI
jgi:hypothetical protein